MDRLRAGGLDPESVLVVRGWAAASHVRTTTAPAPAAIRFCQRRISPHKGFSCAPRAATLDYTSARPGTARIALAMTSSR
jgi:hypothetical protein